MADYIDRSILCQAYIHILEPGIEPSEFDRVREVIRAFAQERGRHFLYGDVDAEVEFLPGSLKVKVTFLGKLTALILAYGALRGGVDYIIKDVKRIADTVSTESLFQAKGKSEDVLRIENRSGVVGTLKRISDGANWLEENNGRVSQAEMHEKIVELRKQVERLSGTLRGEEDREFVSDEVSELLEGQLPNTPQRPGGSPPDPEAIDLYARERRRLIEIVEEEM